MHIWLLKSVVSAILHHLPQLSDIAIYARKQPTTLTGGVTSSLIDWFRGCVLCKICVQIVRDVFPQEAMRALTHR